MKNNTITFVALLLFFAGHGSYADETVLSDQVIAYCNASLVYPDKYDNCEYTRPWIKDATGTCTLKYFYVVTHERVTYTGNGNTVTTRYNVRILQNIVKTATHQNNEFSAMSAAYDQLLPIIEHVKKNICK